MLPFKRWEIAAKALRGLGVTLRVAGPTPSAEYAQAVRAAGDSVELLGEVPASELLRLYAESDFLVHPSAVEVLSATVLEALAAGLPVLGGPAVEGVVEEGISGWVLSDRDPAAVVNGWRTHAAELVRNEQLRRTMGERARAIAQDRFAWPRIVEQHLAVYRSVLGPARSPL